MEIIVHSLEREIPLMLPCDISIATLKSYLETLTGVPAPLQHLHTGRQELIDTGHIRQCTEDVFLELDRSSAFPLRFVVHMPADDAFPLLSKMTDTGLSIKAMITRETRTDASGEMLMLGERQLQDTQTVADVLTPGIFDLFVGVNSMIPYTEVAAHHITIKTYPNDFVVVDIHPSETVSTFLTRWKGPDSWLVYKDRALEPSARLSAICESVAWGDLLLHIRTGGIASFDFAATSTLTVKRLKRAIAKRLAATDISLVYRGLLLEDSYSLKHCGCEREETVEVVLNRYFWVESDTERISVRESALELEASSILRNYRTQTGDLRDFKWMILDGELLQPGLNYSIRSGAVVELTNNGFLLPIATSEGIYHAAVIDSCTVQVLQQELSRRFGHGQILAKKSPLPANLRLPEAKHLPLSFARSNERVFAFHFSDGSIVFLPFNPNSSIPSVVSRLQKALSTTDSLQLTSEGKPISGTLFTVADADFVHVCRNTEVAFVKENGSVISYATLPTFNIKVADLKTYCEKGVVPLFFTSRFLSDDEYLCDCDIKVGSCIQVLDTSDFVSDHTVSPRKVPNKYIILRQLDSTQHLVRLHEDDSWDDFLASVQAIIREEFILLSKQFLFTANRFPTVKSGQVLHIFKSSDEVAVVLSPFGSVEWVHAPRTFTVQQVKAAARVAGDRSLAFQSAVLDDRRTLESLGLTATDTLMPVCPTEYIVKLRRPETESLYLAIKEKTPYVSDLLQFASYCIGSSNSRIYVNGETLKNSERVRLYHEFWLVEGSHIRVLGELSNGTSVYVFVRKNCTVGDLRTKFSERLLVHRSLIRLILSYSALEDDCSTLHQTGLTEDRTVAVLKPHDILVTVVDHQIRLQFQKNRDSSFIEVKEATAKALNTEVKNVHLIYQNQLLSNTRTLESLVTTNELTVQLLLLKTEVPLAFHSLQGQHTLTVLPSDQVNFASVLSAAANVATALYWVGELSNERTVGDYCLQADSEVNLLPHSGCTEEIAMVTIHSSRGVSCMRTSRDCSVKQFLSNFSRNKKRQSWEAVINGEFADISKSLNDYGLEDRYEASMITKDESEVRVILPNGRDVVLVVQSTAVLEVIKEKLCAATGIAKEMQVLSCGGELQNDCTVGTLGRTVKIALEVKHGFQLLECVGGYIVVPCGSVGATKSALNEPSATIMCEDRELREDEVLPVNAMIVRPGEKRIYVKTPLSPAFPVYMKDSDTIKELKERLQTLSHLPHPQMRLIATVPVRGDKELAAIRYSSRTLHFSIGQ